MNNFQRLIQLAEKSFDVRNDPDQLDVDEEVIEKLQQLHEATLSEYADENGPVIWVLLIPTTIELMNRFLQNEITETELLNLTPRNISYEAIYLCSALTLEEFRHKGLTLKLSLKAIENLRRDYPIKFLFVWSFSEEGAKLSKRISEETGIPLLERKSKI